MRTLRRTQGFTLVELLIVMTLSLILLSATLFTFERLVWNSNQNDRLNDTAELARRSLDHQARQLRNLAKRVRNQPVIATVGPYDLVFQTSDPSRTWVRYCLDTSLGLDRGQVWEQTQAADTPGTTTDCSATTSGWASRRLVADSIVNRRNNADRPMFSYRCVGGGSACTTSSATFDQLIGVDAQLYVDTTPGKAPPSLLVSSGVFLRNQNQAPKAVITTPVQPVASTPRTVQLNGSSSSDFEARTLAYYWFLGTMPATSAIDCDKDDETLVGTTHTLWGGTFIGRGVAIQYTWPAGAGATGTAQTVGLVVCDPGGRSDMATTTVSIPQ